MLNSIQNLVGESGEQYLSIRYVVRTNSEPITAIKRVLCFGTSKVIYLRREKPLTSSSVGEIYKL